MATASKVMTPCERKCLRPVQRSCVGIPRYIAIRVLMLLRAPLGSSVPFLIAPAGARYDGVQRADRGVLERPADSDRHARFGQCLVMTVEFLERLCEIVVRGGRPRMNESGPPERLFGRFKITGPMRGISQPYEPREIVGPALERALVGSPRRRERAGLFEPRHGAYIVAYSHARRQASRRQREHRPIAAAPPSVFESIERHLEAPLCARAQGDALSLEVVADRHSVMPGRIPVEGEILQHDHGVSGSDLGEEIRKVRTEFDRDEAIAARRREHLDLQAPVPIGEIDLRPQRLRLDHLASGSEHHCERGRTALIVLLRIKRDRVELCALRNPSGTAPDQGLQLRRGAACKPEKKDARRRKAAGDTPARSRGEDHLSCWVKVKTLVTPRISVTRRITNTRNPITRAVSNPLPPAGSESNRAASRSTSSSLMALTRAFASSGLTPCRSSAARTSARSKSEPRSSRPEKPSRRVASTRSVATSSACTAGIGRPRMHRLTTRARATVRLRLGISFLFN